MNRKVKALQLAIGVDLIGSKLSMASSRNLELTELPHGIEMVSAASGRVIVIPWSNVKGYEVFPKPAVVPAKAK